MPVAIGDQHVLVHIGPATLEPGQGDDALAVTRHSKDERSAAIIVLPCVPDNAYHIRSVICIALHQWRKVCQICGIAAVDMGSAEQRNKNGLRAEGPFFLSAL